MMDCPYCDSVISEERLDHERDMANGDYYDRPTEGEFVVTCEVCRFRVPVVWRYEIVYARDKRVIKR